ncbi:MAG: PAS domain-containing protein [Bacteroidota bacterium]
MPDFNERRQDRGENKYVNAETIEKALHATNNLIVITDPKLDDNPIVWVNDYFCEFTGYDRDEVLGRNCRFLQGEDREQAERFALRDGVDNVYRTHVLIRNYKKSGELFYNDLYVSPVIENGEVIHFVGVQNDATARMQALLDVADAERQVLETAENERERFGMDLHDGLGQTLTGAVMLSHALTRDLEMFSRRDGVLRDLPDEVLDELTVLASHADHLQQQIEKTMSEARAMASGLNPVNDSPHGLGDALRDLVVNVQQSYDDVPEIEVDVADIDFPDRRHARHLYRIAQEALSNAVRHADAARIQIALHQSEDGVVLEVSDDGRGMPDPETAPKPGRGKGLASIRYRARLIGGTIDTRRRSEGGTFVRVVVPVGVDASLPDALLPDGSLPEAA